MPAEELLRIDICWSISNALSVADQVTGALAGAHHLANGAGDGERGAARRVGAPFCPQGPSPVKRESRGPGSMLAWDAVCGL